MPLDCTSATVFAIVVLRSSARRSTQLGPGKSVPGFCASQHSPWMSLFSIADMHIPLRGTGQLRGAPQIIEPAHALLLPGRNPCRVYLSPERGRCFEFVTRPEFCRRQTRRQAIRCDRRTGVRRHPANQIGLAPFPSIFGPGGRSGQAGVPGRRRLESQFRGVLQDKDRTRCRLYPQGGRAEMSGWHLVFADVVICKEPLRRLCICPMLTGGRQRFAGLLFKGFRHCAKPSVQPGITQIAIRPAVLPPGSHASTRRL